MENEKNQTEKERENAEDAAQNSGSSDGEEGKEYLTAKERKLLDEMLKE